MLDPVCGTSEVCILFSDQGPSFCFPSPGQNQVVRTEAWSFHPKPSMSHVKKNHEKIADKFASDGLIFGVVFV